MTPAGRSLAPLVVLLLVLHWAALGEAAMAAERRILLDFKSAITADPDGALGALGRPVRGLRGDVLRPGHGRRAAAAPPQRQPGGTSPIAGRGSRPRVRLALERASRRDPCGYAPFAHRHASSTSAATRCRARSRLLGASLPPPAQPLS
ncbi:hypothetical protein ZWY2020_026015 [Hordeum vulgare]|nr:hypothetical protein ZWY2020_026015 [Hordeum vulgare]